MSLWGWVLLACGLAYATKLLGYAVPERALDNPAVLRTSGAVTVGLLTALVVVNTVGDGQGLALDARAGALVAAVVALCCRAPFLLVVLVGAATAAALRLMGLP